MIPILEGATIVDLSRWNPETEADFKSGALQPTTSRPAASSVL